MLTGLVCYMLSHFSRVWLCATLWTVACELLCPWYSPGKNTGVGCHSLLHGIFPTQGLNQCLLHLLHCRQILYHLSHQESPTFLSLYRKGLASFRGKFVFHLQGYTCFHKVKWNSLFKYSGKCKKTKNKKEARRWSGCSPVSPLFSMNNHYRIRSCRLFLVQQTTAQRQTSWK